MAVAEALTEATDSIRCISPNAKIIIAGDFNDEADDDALLHIYAKSFINATSNAKGSNGAKATYKYRGRWQSIDHILVSKSLENDILCAYINDAPFLLTKDEQYGGKKPRRTYTGMKHNGEGYSDHLPLVIRLSLR